MSITRQRPKIDKSVSACEVIRLLATPLSCNLWDVCSSRLKCAKLQMIFHVKIETKWFIISRQESAVNVKLDECACDLILTTSDFQLLTTLVELLWWKFFKILIQIFFPGKRFSTFARIDVRLPVNWPWLKLILNVLKNVPRPVKRKLSFDLSLVVCRCFVFILPF